MKPQELNHDELQNTNGGSGLLDGILGGNDNNSHSSNGSGHSSNGSGNNNDNNYGNSDSSLPIVGDLLDI